MGVGDGILIISHGSPFVGALISFIFVLRFCFAILVEFRDRGRHLSGILGPD